MERNVATQIVDNLLISIKARSATMLKLADIDDSLTGDYAMLAYMSGLLADLIINVDGVDQYINGRLEVIRQNHEHMIAKLNSK